ncbi:MAG: tetratricopeptide repeat protein, partial [Sphingobacteriaceae bacterium]|nr:tetratricopeptide repeat protein [Cytophagaceae bacterium]
MLLPYLARTALCGLSMGLFSLAAWGQLPLPQSLDSLETYVRTVKTRDTNYVRALNELAWQLLGTTAPTRADSLAEVAEKMSVSLRYGPGLFDSYSRRGRLFYLQSQYSKAMTFYEKAAEVVRRQRLGPVYQQTALADLAMINILTGNQQKALDLALQSIRVYESARLPKLKGSPYEVAADVLKQTGKREEALTYLKRSLAIKTRDGNAAGARITENRIGSLLNDLYRYSEAIPHLERARRGGSPTNNAMLQVDVAMNLSASHRFLNRYAKALEVLQDALPFAQALG